MRCRVLVILLDMAGTDGRDPWDDYASILSELEAYQASLLERPRLIVANKIDEPGAEEKLAEFKRQTGEKNVLEISAAFDLGIDVFKNAIKAAVNPQA